jgi:hypothetical protein
MFSLGCMLFLVNGCTRALVIAATCVKLRTALVVTAKQFASGLSYPIYLLNFTTCRMFSFLENYHSSAQEFNGIPVRLG